MMDTEALVDEIAFVSDRLSSLLDEYMHSRTELGECMTAVEMRKEVEAIGERFAKKHDRICATRRGQ